MKTYDIDVHFDASIRMHGIIAESEEQAREIARRTAKEMNLFAAAVEREDAGEKVAESHELTPQEIRREEREQVQELVPWLLEQQTPTEWHDCAADPLVIDGQVAVVGRPTEDNAAKTLIVQGAILGKPDFSLSLYTAWLGSNADIIRSALDPAISKLKTKAVIDNRQQPDIARILSRQF